MVLFAILAAAVAAPLPKPKADPTVYYSAPIITAPVEYVPAPVVVDEYYEPAIYLSDYYSVYPYEHVVVV